MTRENSSLCCTARSAASSAASVAVTIAWAMASTWRFPSWLSRLRVSIWSATSPMRRMISLTCSP